MQRIPRRAATALATGAATALVSAGLMASPAQAAPTEHITNGTFSSTTDPWWATSNVTMSATGGQLCAQVPSGTVELWDAIVGYNGIPLVKGDVYTVTFEASASVPTTIKTNLQLSEEPYTAVMSRDTALTSQLTAFTYTSTSAVDDEQGAFALQLGGGSESWRFCLDNVSVTSEPGTVDPNGPEQVTNGGFDEGLSGWYTYETTSAAVTDGQLCAVVPAGLENPWDAGIGQNDIPLVEDERYTFAFEASASPAASIRATVQLGEDPYTAYLTRTIALTGDAKQFTYTFTASASTTIAQVAFQVGGASTETTICVDNVSLRGGPTE
ncbi:MAG: hypothetical protein HKP61_09895 [Dactylosporangium sp.]|nr:carbohydrate binding domain-containing protein [Dactylosporangium sp.]NNJ61242.1 hypothetical protein [Dactylosporangium sp.]